MIFHENRLPADDSHEISCLIRYFLKSSTIWKCCLLQIVGGALRVKTTGCMGKSVVDSNKTSHYRRQIRSNMSAPVRTI